MKTFKEMLLGLVVAVFAVIAAVYFSSGYHQGLLLTSWNVTLLLLLSFIFPLIAPVYVPWTLLAGSRTYGWFPLGGWGVAGTAVAGVLLAVFLITTAWRFRGRRWAWCLWTLAFGVWFVTAIFSLFAVTGGA